MAEPLPPNAAVPKTSNATTTLIGLSLVALFLLPALLNGFPWVMDDSIAYSGQGVNWMRAKTAAVLIAPLHGLIGYWALPVFNAAVNAAAWLLLIRSFHLRSYWLVLPLAVLALQPLYTSAVLVDSWFFAAVVFLIVSVRKNSPFLALFAGILFSGHASGLILASVLALLIAIFFGIRKAIVMPVLAIVTTVGVSSFLDAKYFPETPSLGRTFLAARLFSVQPVLLRAECERSNTAVLCDAASLIETIRERPENAGRRDFFWDVMRAFPDRFELATFERDHAWPIIRAAITQMPLETGDIILRDFLSFYGTGTHLDFIAHLNEPMPQPFANSWQAQGIWQSEANLAVLTGLRLLLYASLAAAFVFGWRRTDDDKRRWLFILLLICLANDSLFAVVSGPPDRYHHRILPLMAAATCLLVLAQQRRDVQTSPQRK
jgi:hypothetical protein